MKALIVGGAACVMEDAERALALFTPDAIFAVNDMIGRWPGAIDYACTLHPEHLPKWIKARRVAGLNENFQIWSNVNHKQVHRRADDWTGSSGLFAVIVALQERASHIVLAGVPMTAKAGHIVRKRPWMQASAYYKSWNKRHDRIAPFVRSMSGWTQEQLGFPTAEWFATETPCDARPVKQ